MKPNLVSFIPFCSRFYVIKKGKKKEEEKASEDQG